MYDLNIKFDYDATEKYRQNYEYQCDCAYCRNYYRTFKTTYPKISAFLEESGLDANFPLETMPLEYHKKDNTMGYTAYYPVKGEIFGGTVGLNIEGLEIRILKGSNSSNPCPNPQMEEPYLLVEINCIKLDWVLDEEIE